jgi:peptidylprolyl isomerase
MAQAKEGDKVRVQYEGFLDDGSLFDSASEDEPFEFILGEGTVIPGFENAVMGMNEGDEKTVSVGPDEAYGDYRNDLVGVVERSQIPNEIDPEVGMVLQARSPEGAVTNVTVTDLTDDTLTLDGNHPLAGKELKFDIKLVEIA